MKAIAPPATMKTLLALLLPRRATFGITRLSE
jgi:hypothetical protein